MGKGHLRLASANILHLYASGEFQIWNTNGNTWRKGFLFNFCHCIRQPLRRKRHFVVFINLTLNCTLFEMIISAVHCHFSIKNFSKTVDVIPIEQHYPSCVDKLDLFIGKEVKSWVNNYTYYWPHMVDLPKFSFHDNLSVTTSTRVLEICIH